MNKVENSSKTEELMKSDEFHEALGKAFKSMTEYSDKLRQEQRAKLQEMTDMVRNHIGQGGESLG